MSAQCLLERQLQATLKGTPSLTLVQSTLTRKNLRRNTLRYVARQTQPWPFRIYQLRNAFCVSHLFSNRCEMMWGGAPCVVPSRCRSLGESPDFLRKLTHFFFKPPVLVAPVRKRGAQSGVKFARLRSPRNFRNVCGADSCAGDNDDAFPRSFGEFGANGGSLQRALRAAGRQDSFRTSLDHIFERWPQIDGLVKRAVIRHRQRMRKFNQFPPPLNVDTSAFRQSAQYDAIHPRFFGVSDRVSHF